MRIKDIVITGMLGAILFLFQLGLAFLPNIELVSILIIVYTIVMKKKTIFIITVFVLLEGIFYGFSTWWINYLYIWFVLYLITQLFQKERSPLLWALISGAYGLSFGALCSVPYFFMGGYQTAFAYWISGIPFDITHGIANFCIALILFKPFHTLMDYLHDSYYHAG